MPNTKTPTKKPRKKKTKVALGAVGGNSNFGKKKTAKKPTKRA